MKFSSVFCSIDSFVQMDLFNFHQFQSVSVELTWNPPGSPGMLENTLTPDIPQLVSLLVLSCGIGGRGGKTFYCFILLEFF